MKRALLAGVLMVAGCGTNPSAQPQGAATNGRLRPGAAMMLFSKDHDVIFVIPKYGELVEVPVGTKVTVLDDESETMDPSRSVRVRVEEGKSAGSVGVVDRHELRPPFSPN